MSTFRHRLSQVVIHRLADAPIVFVPVTGASGLAELPNTAPEMGKLRIRVVVGALVGAPVVSRLALHVLAALYHRCVLRDRPMARVGLGRA